jgi:very-short-patch-repair endonuclease
MWHCYAMAYQEAKSSERARALRKSDTEAERRLWERLRSRRLGGFKFVRRLPVGPYIADFACRECKLIVEVDGATHSSDEEVSHDARRSDFLEAQGYRVMSFWNDAIYKNLDDVLDAIFQALERR